MSSSLIQLHFAVEFLAFLVAAAGLGVDLLGPAIIVRSRAGRALVAGGFCCSAAAAFIEGSLLGALGMHPATAGLRLAGAGLLLGASVGPAAGGWAAGRGSAPLWWAAVAAQCLSVVSLGLGWPQEVTLSFLGAANVAFAVVLVRASGRAIAARVATASGATLLVVVLVLSIALSTVAVSTVRSDALRRLGATASVQASQLEALPTGQLQRSALLLTQLAEGYAQTHCASAARQACLGRAASAYGSTYFSAVGGVVWVSPAGQVAGAAGLAAGGAGSPVGAEVASSAAVRETISQRAQVDALELIGGRPLAIATYPDLRSQSSGTLPSTLVGVAVVVQPVGSRYLDGVRSLDPTVALALVSGGKLSASSGPKPSLSALRRQEPAALASAGPSSLLLGERYVSVEPLRTLPGTPPLALVASEPAQVVLATRNSLIRTLFLIALGGTLLSLVLAGLVGDRVGARLRRLTIATRAIREGRPGTRVEMEAEDEVGVLGEAFDAMAASIDEKTAALLLAAEDESRLRGRMEAVVAGMGEALVAVDGRGVITDFNRAAEQLVGVPAEKAVGLPVGEVLSVTDEAGEDLSSRLGRPPRAAWS
ncbi:MAG: HAMP domain-containing protein, partial [Acidimicrobiales bacterium]